MRVRAPMLAIHTVAAGGGSILPFDGARFRVGPESAGADPGPACYRRGGPLTVTDANVVLGSHPRSFPAVFGPDADRAARRRGRRASASRRWRPRSPPPPVVARSPEAGAEGCVEIAVANMVNAIKRVSVQRGHDVTRYALVSFGGAGGQHACAVADALGIDTVLVHPLAGVLSAYGMGLADRRAMRERAVEATPTLRCCRRLAARSASSRRRRAPSSAARGWGPRASPRSAGPPPLQGTDTALEVPAGDAR